jgi:hypothetical protein
MVPLAIIKNTAVPLGLILMPTESARGMQKFKDLMDAAAATIGIHFDWHSIRILGDMGAGLRKFCEDNGIPLFICYFHLIRAFGTCSPAAKIVRDALWTATREEWESKRAYLAQEIVLLLDEGLINAREFTRLMTFIGSNFTDRLNPPAQLLFTDFQHAIYDRIGVATCNNNCEGLHGHFNNMVPLRSPLVVRLDSLWEYTYEKGDEFLKNGDDVHRRGARTTVHRICRTDGPDSCDCPWGEINAAMLGLRRGICPHIKAPELSPADFLPMPTFQQFQMLPVAGEPHAEVAPHGDDWGADVEEEPVQEEMPMDFVLAQQLQDDQDVQFVKLMRALREMDKAKGYPAGNSALRLGGPGVAELVRRMTNLVRDWGMSGNDPRANMVFFEVRAFAAARDGQFDLLGAI